MSLSPFLRELSAAAAALPNSVTAQPFLYIGTRAASSSAPVQHRPS